MENTHKGHLQEMTKAVKRVIDSFEALGESKTYRDTHMAKRECEGAMEALKDALQMHGDYP